MIYVIIINVKYAMKKQINSMSIFTNYVNNNIKYVIYVMNNY